jgi:carboxyl-terminal processing protease
VRQRLLLAAAVSLTAGIWFDALGQDASFRQTAAAINTIIRANHYHRAELDSDAYRQIERDTIALGEKATSADEFMTGFVTLAWQGSTAVLTVTTMNGVDTIKAIDAAYGEIVTRKAGKLIIDLRKNGGGAFAVVPLVGHLIDKPIDAGVFVVGSWYADHREPPGPADFPSAKPWRGYSVRAFQEDVVTRPLTSYRIDPIQPRFRGPVVVLISARSISAAEIAADVLKSTGRAKLVGEKTPGIVLSSKVFDIPGGFHLRVPIADYYSISNGRLEGSGVTPDISATADQALEVGLGLQP